MSFKRGRASPDGGRLAKEVNNFHRPHQTTFTLPTVNAVFYVDGYIDKTPTQFLLDSGAAMSVVNYNVVREQPITKVNTCAVGANGTPLDVVGQTTVTLQLADFRVDHEFTVVHSLTTDCLLGADFLQRHGAILDCCNNTLSLGQALKTIIPINLAKQPSSPPNSHGPVTSSICVACDIEIPGRTVQLISGQVDNTCGDISVVLVEPLLNLPDQLYVGRSLSSVCNNQVPIQVMNISPSPVTLYKGMRLGTATSEQNILLVSDKESLTKPQPPSFDHLHFPNLSSSERTDLTNLLLEFCDIFHQVRVLLGTRLQLNMPYLPPGHLFVNLYADCLNP